MTSIGKSATAALFSATRPFGGFFQSERPCDATANVGEGGGAGRARAGAAGGNTTTGPLWLASRPCLGQGGRLHDGDPKGIALGHVQCRGAVHVRA